jgi:AmmeMemoRadiSam system protein B
MKAKSLVFVAVVSMAGTTMLTRPTTPPILPPKSVATRTDAVERTLRPGRFFDERTFARARLNAQVHPVLDMSGLRAIIVPHHWLAGSLIIRGLRDAAAAGPFARVILIGPDHVDAGAQMVSTSGLPWDTEFGRAEPDRATIRRLVGAGVAGVQPGVLTGDHSIAGLVPAVRAFFPMTPLVPLAIRSRMTEDDVARLVEALHPLLGTSLVIASIDFSHYLSATEAGRRDRETISAIRRFDTPRVLEFGNDNLDSPGSLAIVLELMRSIGAARVRLIENTDSSAFGGSTHDVTSYLLATFTSKHSPRAG